MVAFDEVAGLDAEEAEAIAGFGDALEERCGDVADVVGIVGGFTARGAAGDGAEVRVT